MEKEKQQNAQGSKRTTLHMNAPSHDMIYRDLNVCVFALIGDTILLERKENQQKAEESKKN